MANENQDLLDLCRLNLMEENIEESPDPERDSVLDLITMKKRTLATKVINNAPVPTDAEMATHIERNDLGETT